MGNLSYIYIHIIKTRIKQYFLKLPGTGMLEKLMEIDKEALLWINQWHLPWLDPVMYVLTKNYTWIPLYVLLIYLMFRIYQKQMWRPLLLTALVVVLTDRITSGLMKPFFARPRPTHNPELSTLLHTVNNYTGGEFGFASSHAANSFGLALFLWWVLGHYYPKVVWLFAWAALMAYTRLYLGVHYPGDIVAGILVGVFCAWMVYRPAQQWLEQALRHANTK
jgi:undecaprenyl-diphosphatase